MSVELPDQVLLVLGQLAVHGPPRVEAEQAHHRPLPKDSPVSVTDVPHPGGNQSWSCLNK